MKSIAKMMQVGALTALMACSGSAQDWARTQLEQSPRHREWVELKQNGRTLRALVIYPQVNYKAPVVLVIHEIFGLTDWAQKVADEFASAGFIAIAPDLLSGMGTDGQGTSGMTQSDAIKAVSGLNADQVMKDLKAVSDYALRWPAATQKLYVAGFCWGGGQAFRFATDRPDLAGAFVFYGPAPDKDAMAHINAPVYGFYGGNDARIGATVPATVEAMTALGKKYEPVTYEGAGHGFMRQGEAPDASPADQKARTDAWQRLQKLMQ